MRKVIFIQPALPVYRKPFFEKLSKMVGGDVYVVANVIDALGVRSVNNIDCNFIRSDGLKKIFGGFFYWNKGVEKVFSIINENDIVVINGNPRVINYMFFALYAKNKKAKIIWWGHGRTSGSSKVSLLIRRYLSRFFDAVLLYTDNEINFFDPKSVRVFALNNGLDTEFIHNEIGLDRIKKSIRNKKQSKKINLVFSGRITKKCKLDILLEVLTFFSEDEVHLNIVGDGELYNELYSLSKDLGVFKMITWHGAIYDEKLLSEVFMSSHYFVYPGSVGLSLIHGYNYGLPALVHNEYEHHMPEIAAFADNINGFCFDRDNISSLCDCIKKLQSISDTDYYSMCLVSLNTAIEKYNINVMANRFIDVISKI